MRGLSGRGLRTAIITNSVREWQSYWHAKVPDFSEIFEVVVDSGFVGVRKPERAIFELALERLGGVEAGDCVFIDDVEVNCEAARDLGMRAVHFRDTDQAISDLEAALGSS